MKKLFYLPVIMIVLFFSNCEEEGPFIILTPTAEALVDTTYIDSNPVEQGEKNVLIEEFSGVRCSNCPKGYEKVTELLADYPGRIVPISAHSDFLATPYGDDQDLRNDDANDLSTLIGGVSSKPAASFNRKLFQNETNIAIKNPDSWEQFVIDELALSTPVNIELELLEKDVTERTLLFRVKLSYSEMSSNHNLGLALIENKIIADQQDGIVKIEDYEHKHVLRKFISPIIGSPLNVELVQNTVIIKEFKIDLDTYNENGVWEIENMALIAFVRQSNNEIINAKMLEW